MENKLDFVVVGSGVAGLVGAIAAHDAGLKPIIIEKSDKWGGTTSLSGGVLWVPQNHLMRDKEPDDTPEMARTYVHGLLGPDAGTREIAKADAFLETAPEMVQMLETWGVRWMRTDYHPDYYPETPGNATGRTIEPAPFDGKRLGDRLRTMRNVDLDLPAINSGLFGPLTCAWSGPGPFLTAARVAIEHQLRKLAGQKPLGLGRALVAALMEIVIRRGIPVELSTGLVELIEENGAVVGIVVEHAGARRRLDAPAGVLLAAGGFAQNAMLRKQLQHFEKTWSNAIPEDQGDALQAAMAVGAETELLDDCWWMPSIEIGPGQFGLALGLRALPGSIVVNAKGRRYMNEARSYMTTGKTMRMNGAAEERHWLIMDSRFLNHYIFAELSQKSIREKMMRNGTLKRADTIAELAMECGIDADELQETVDRFNGFARNGEDHDFRRGTTEYDRHWADPSHKPNACLGEIKKPPYWAAVIRPGDLGTNGGVKTDSKGRVLGAGDRPIPGLYAAGNSSGSPFGRCYPGAGATIGSAATFSYIAARDAASQRTNERP